MRKHYLQASEVRPPYWRTSLAFLVVISTMVLTVLALTLLIQFIGTNDIGVGDPIWPQSGHIAIQFLLTWWA